MELFRKIICPVDFSEASEAAYHHAEALSRKVNGNLTLMHVVPDVSEAYHALMPDFPTLNAPKVEDILYRFKEFTGDWTGRLKKELRVGTPYHEILQYADEAKADLIVLGAKGISKMDRLFLGTTAERVVRHATCPVLTVHKTTKSPAVKKILLPVDFSHPSEEILPLAAGLATLYDAELYLLHIVEIGHHFDEESQQREFEHFEKMKEKLEFLWHTSDDLKEIEARKMIRHHIGSPGYGIVEFAQDWDIDLIVMTTQGRTGFSKMLVGSVAEKVIRIAPCPVLSIKKGAMTGRSEIILSQKSTAGR